MKTIQALVWLVMASVLFIALALDPPAETKIVIPEIRMTEVLIAKPSAEATQSTEIQTVVEVFPEAAVDTNVSIETKALISENVLPTAEILIASIDTINPPAITVSTVVPNTETVEVPTVESQTVNVQPTQIVEVVATPYPGTTPLNCQNGVCPLVFKETNQKACDLDLQIPNTVQELYNMMVRNDGKLCWYNQAPMCGELYNPYIDWALIQLMTYPKDNDHESVMAYSKTLKEVSSLRGIYLNIGDDETIKIEESTIFKMLLESTAANETCSDPEGRPVINKVDRFVNALNSFVIPLQ